MLINRGQQPWLSPVLVFIVQQTSNSSQDYQVSGELLINREDLSFRSSTAVERAIAQCTSRWAMARGHRLNTSIVLAAVYGLSGLF